MTDDASDGEALLEVRNLEKHFDQSGSFVDGLLGRTNRIQAVDGVSFDLSSNQSHGIIGESGCGKSTLLMTLMGLHDTTGGEIRYQGQPLTGDDGQGWRKFRKDAQMIFQDPFNSLDPKFTVEETIVEPLEIHGMTDREERVTEALADVGLAPPENFLSKYPSQLSGGELQRVSIARALVTDPEVLLADEPVSMLDVSTQASVLKLLSNLMEERGLSLVYISHDLSTVSYVCDVVHVMYLGRVIETAPTLELIENPQHPYTQALINAIPLPDPHFERGRTAIEGIPRDPIDIGEGCRFRDRCPEAMDVCEKTPRYVEVEDGHYVACHLHYDHHDAVEKGHQPEPGEA